MANIKGIKIEIGGNTEPLQKALKNVETQSKKTSTEIKQIDKALKFDPRNIVLIAQKQELLSKQIGTTKEKLESLRSVQSQVEQQFQNGDIGEEKYRAFQREIATTESSLKSYKTQLANLKQEQENLGTSSKRLEGFFKATGKTIDDFKDVLGDKLTNSIKEGKASSKELEKALKLMAESAAGGKVDITELKQSLDALDDGGSVENVKNQLEELGKTAQETSLKTTNNLLNKQALIAGAESIAQVGEKVIDFGKKSQEAFREVDSGMDIIITKTGIVSEEGVSNLKAIYDQLSVELPVDNFEIVGSAIGEVNTQFGFLGDELKENSANFIKFAEINQADVTTSVLETKEVMSAWSRENSELTSTLDTLSFVARQTGQSTSYISSTLTKQAPILQELNLTYEESALLIGKLAQSGLDGDRVLNSLTKAQSVAAKEGKSLKDSMGELEKVIASGATETEKLSAANELFGAKNGAYMLKALKENKLAFDDLGISAQETAGTVAKTFEATLDPIDKQQQASNALKQSFAELGNEISEAFFPLLEIVIPIIQAITEAFSSLPEPLKQFIVLIGGIVAGFAVLAPIIAGVATLITTIGTSAVAAFLPIIGIVAGIIVAITSLANIFSSLYESNESFRSAVDTAWNFILTIIQSVTNEIFGFVTGIWSTITAFWTENQDLILSTAQSVWTTVSSVIQGVMTFLQPFIAGTWETIKATVLIAWEAIKAIITITLNLILGAIKLALQVISGDWSGAWETIKTTTSSVMETVKNLISNSIEIIKSAISNTWSSVSQTTSSVWEGIKSTISSAISGAKNAVANAIQAIKNLFNFKIQWPHIPLPHFSVSGSANPLRWLTEGVPRISVAWYAKGGILTKPTAFGMNGNSLMVGGEAGREAVLPLNEQTLGMIGRGIAKTMGNLSESKIEIHIENPSVRSETDIQAIAQAVIKKIELTKIQRNRQWGGGHFV